MWVVEVNVAGRRYTHRVSARSLLRHPAQLLDRVA